MKSKTLRENLNLTNEFNNHKKYTKLAEKEPQMFNLSTKNRAITPNLPEDPYFEKRKINSDFHKQEL